MAKVVEEDKRFVASYLNIKEQELFFKLQVSEQRHCINVAYDVNNHIEGESRDYLIRLALLHDIGKVGIKLTPIDKAILVVLDKLTKGKLRKHSRYKKIHVYYNHGEIGYKLLQAMGRYNQEFLKRVRDHHSNGNTEDEVLRILQKWDDKN